MPGDAFAEILRDYGQTVRVHRGEEDRIGTAARAFFQPVLTRREDWKQRLPTPIGVRRQDRFLYLGEPGVPLEGPGDCVLSYCGMQFEVQACQPIYVGERLSHWWAVLLPRDEEEI